MKKLRLLLFLLLAPFLASATISITVNNPGTGYTYYPTDNISIDVSISSTYSVDTVRAIILNRSVLLTQKAPYNNYVGTLSLAGLQAGTYSLIINVKDVLGNSSSAARSFKVYIPPIVTILQPTDNSAFLTSKIRVKASVSAPGQTNCAGKVMLGNYKFNFTNNIDTTLDVLPNSSSYEGVLLVKAIDDNAFTTTAYKHIYIDKNNFLEPFFSDTGRVVDFKDTRVLILKTDSNNIPHLKIVNTSNGSAEIINLGSNVTSTTFLNGMLVAGGAELTLNYDYENNQTADNVYIWRNGILNKISDFHTSTCCGFVTQGNFLVWPRSDDALILTNVTTLFSDTIATNVANRGYDIGPPGAVVYSPNLGGIKKYTINTGSTQTISNSGFFPAVDGNNIVYLTPTPHYRNLIDIHINDGVTDTIVGKQNFSEKWYKLSDGYISFTKLDNSNTFQVWTRSPAKVYKQQSFFSGNSYIDAMSNKGRVIFSNDTARYYIDSLTTFTRVQGRLGTVYKIDTNFYVAEGNNIFKFNLSPVKLHSKVLSFSPTSAGAGDTVTIKGSNFSTATNVTFGETPATSFHVISDSLITAVVGSGASGSVAVTTSGGAPSLPGFTYLLPPIITSLSKTTASEGNSVGIYGFNFTKATSVTFGGTPAASFGVLSDGSIYSVVGQGSTGDVVVTTPYGSAHISGFTFVGDATLTTLALSPKISLTTTTGPGYRNYTATVPSEVSSVQVIATAHRATSSITVNGVAVASGTPSQVILLALGNNTININVTAHDGVTSDQYIITLYRNASFDASLANLSVSNVALSPVFAKTTLSYTATVPYATSSTTVTPTTNATTSTVKINGTAVASGQASAAIPLAVGLNTITTTVTAENGTTQTYTVKITRAAANLSTNAVLSILALTPKTSLTVVSGPGYRNYTASVAGNVSSVQVTPTAQDATATIKVNGVAVTSGALSQAVPLNMGANTINVVVTAQDGATVKSYIVTVTRHATLSSLVLSAGTLNPVFDSGTASYSAIVPYATPSLTVTPTSPDASATIKVKGVTVASGSASAAIPLAVGSNTITTTVTAYDGTSTQTYTTTVTRAASNLSTNAVLSVLALTPKTSLTVVSGSGYRNYTASVAGNVSSVQVTPTAQDATATIKVNGTIVASGALSKAIALTLGANIINVVVTAQDGATVKNYIITVNRPAMLSNLAFSAGTLSPAFAPATTVYSTRIPYASSSITVTPVTAVANATIKVNGVTVASGSASAVIPLAVGANNITTTITTHDGVVTLTYLTTVTRAAANLSTNAVLSVISLTPRTTLTNSTGPGYRNYTASVANGVSSVQVTPISQDANATIKVNGTTVVSGALSKPILLSVGSNVITTVVTAQDGATTKSYIITVTRAAAGFAAQLETADNSTADGIKVHQGVSPNGDGSEDVLTIDGIDKYPDNTLQIMGRSGELVYEAKGYDNAARVFNGHASATGKLQPAGTYFYSLEYKEGNQTKRKTGFIVLKY